MRAFPKGILDRPSDKNPSMIPYIEPTRKPVGKVDMSLQNAVGKRLGGRVVRQRTYTKIKHAIAFVVIRGADAEEGEDGEQRIVFREEESGGERWILPSECHLWCELEGMWLR